MTPLPTPVAIGQMTDVSGLFDTAQIRAAEDRAEAKPAIRTGNSGELQRGPLGLIEPGAGISGEPKEHRRRVAVATCRGRDAGIAGKTKPGEASTQVIPAVMRPWKGGAQAAPSTRTLERRVGRADRAARRSSSKSAWRRRRCR